MFQKEHKKYPSVGWSHIYHVYSSVPIAVADHRLARQIMACQSWFKRNRNFAFGLCIKGALYLHMWYSTLAYNIAFVTSLPTGRSRVTKKSSSRSQSKTNWHLWNRLLLLAYTTHTYAIQHNKQSSIPAI